MHCFYKDLISLSCADLVYNQEPPPRSLKYKLFLFSKYYVLYVQLHCKAVARSCVYPGQEAEDDLAESTLLLSIPLVLIWGDSDSPPLGDVQQCLETFLVVTRWEKCTANIYG